MSQAKHKRVPPKSCFDKLDSALKQTLERYFKTLCGHQTSGLHRLVTHRIEKLLLEYVLDKTDYNYSQTAKILGISRATLRHKMTHYKINRKTKPSKKVKG